MLHGLLHLAGLGQCVPSAVAQRYSHVPGLLQYGGQSQTEWHHMCVGVLKVEEGR